MDVNEGIRKEASRRKYSERTIEAYQNCVNRFFKSCGKEAREVTKKDVREFLEKLSEKSSGRKLKIAINGSYLDTDAHILLGTRSKAIKEYLRNYRAATN